MKKLFLGLFFSLLIPSLAFSGPTLIKDSRMWDLTTTPVLGRGYSAVTNTFQSACLQNVVLTEPSYDFDYKFTEITSEEDISKATSFSVAADWARTTFAASRDKTTTSNRKTHTIIVDFVVDTYYASVDESASKISDTARQLLERQDVPGFFASCGPYYVRGITRQANFVSILTFTAASDKEASDIKASLTYKIRGIPFFGGGGEFKASAESKSSSTSSNTQLTIVSRAWGLGKQGGATLVSSSIEELKEAIKAAFISTQNPLTGRVQSVEIIPWVENTDFQATLNLLGKDIVDGKEVPLHQKKDILTYNAEFMAEASRAGRNRLDIYYKAKVCKDAISGAWYDTSNNLIPQYASRELVNNRTGFGTMSVADLDKSVTDKTLEDLWNSYANFMYAGTPSVESCFNNLMADPNQKNVANEASTNPSAAAAQRIEQDYAGEGRGLFLQRYFAHNECKSIQKLFPVQMAQAIDDFCMPTLR